MKIVTFAHSLASCWNHGNAHFLRGLLRELVRRGHDVVAFERADGWSRHNLVRDHGQSPLARFAALFPELTAVHYTDGADVSAMLDGADLAIVHEWTDPELVREIGAVRKRSGKFLLLFTTPTTARSAMPRHSGRSTCPATTACSPSAPPSPRSTAAVDGETASSSSTRRRTSRRSRRPPTRAPRRRRGLVWIGNWGDEERSELHTYLLRPARDAGISLDVYGVRYPDAARQALETHGARYHGWVANTDVPSVFGRHLATVHVPRRPYTQALPGIPTIRVFEALACGIPLVSAPWRDEEGLFRPGRDFLLASSEEDMRQADALAADPDLRAALAASGLARIRERHTCAHRADELLAIAASLAPHQLAKGAA